jgi:hypothetical protein
LRKKKFKGDMGRNECYKRGNITENVVFVTAVMKLMRMKKKKKKKKEGRKKGEEEGHTEGI